MQNIYNLISSCSAGIASCYQQLPDIVSRVDLLRSYFSNTEGSSKVLSPSKISEELTVEKFKSLIALIKKDLQKTEELLQQAENHCIEHKHSPMELLQYYLSKNNIEKVESILKDVMKRKDSKFKLPLQEFTLFARQMIDKMVTSGDSENKEKITNLLKDVLQFAIEETDKINVKWQGEKKDFAVNQSPLSAEEILSIEDRLTLYIHIAYCHEKLIKPILAKLILNKASQILPKEIKYEQKRGNNKYNIAELNLLTRMFYQYAEAYSKIDKEESDRYLEKLKNIFDVFNSSKEILNITIIIVNSHIDLLSKWYDCGRIFMNILENLQKRIVVSNCTEKKNISLNRPFSIELASFYSKIVFLKSHLRDDFLSSFNELPITEPFEIAQVYKNIGKGTHENIGRACDNLIAALNLKNNPDFYEKIDLIQKIALDYHANQNNKLSPFLQMISQQSNSIKKEQQLPFVYAVIEIHKKTGLEKEADEFFEEFQLSNPESLRNPSDRLRDAELFLKMGQNKLAKRYLQELEKTADSPEKIYQIVKLYNQFEPETALQLIEEHGGKMRIGSSQQSYSKMTIPLILLGLASAALLYRNSSLINRTVTWLRQNGMGYVRTNLRA